MTHYGDTTQPPQQWRIHSGISMHNFFINFVVLLLLGQAKLSRASCVLKFCIIWKSCIIASCYHIISFLIYSICLYCWLLTKSSPPGNIFHKTHSLIVCDKMHTNFLEMLWNPLIRKPIIFHCRLTEFMIVSYKKWMSRFTWCLRQKHIQRGDFLYPTNRR